MSASPNPEPTPADVADFDARFSGVARFFTAAELRFGGQSNEPGGIAAGLNHLAPRELWGNIVPTLRMADATRAFFGRPLRILSAYRSPAYNKAIGGAGASYHMRFQAIDLAPVQGGASEVERLHGCARLLRDKGTLTGGIGFYPWGIHIDCGPRREW